jgi:hypothetical protein
MCDLEIPKISKVLDTISEVMNWMERQSDCDHLHFLHPQNIKTCMMKKRHQLLCQKKISDCFKNTDWIKHAFKLKCDIIFIVQHKQLVTLQNCTGMQDSSWARCTQMEGHWKKQKKSRRGRQFSLKKMFLAKFSKIAQFADNMSSSVSRYPHNNKSFTVYSTLWSHRLRFLWDTLDLITKWG